MTGEISIKGRVNPVGGIVLKVEAAENAGIKKVIIPKDNWQEKFEDLAIDIIPVATIDEVISAVFSINTNKYKVVNIKESASNILAATSSQQ